MPNLTLPTQTPQVCNDTNSIPITYGKNNFGITKIEGAKTPTTKLKHNSKSFKPKFIQNRNTGGK